MSVTVKMTAEYRPKGPDAYSAPKISAGNLCAWLSDLPPEATIEPIRENRGDQRESYYVTVGFKASWEQEFGTGVPLSNDWDQGVH